MTKKKKCKVCKKQFEQFRSLQTVCSRECALVVAKKKTEQKAKKQASMDKKLNQLAKQELMAPSKYVSVYIQPIFNEIARLIDKDLPCIARGTYGKMDGGHYRSVANNTTIRLNLHNIHRQGVYSNQHKGGDNIEYMDGLIKEYGRDYLDFVHYHLNTTPVLKLTTKDYIEIRSIVSEIRNKLKKADKRYSLNERIELRNSINKEIAIYTDEYCIFNQHKQ